MYISVDDNPNCQMDEARVFQERGEPRPVTHVLRRLPANLPPASVNQQAGIDVWCPIISWNEHGPAAPAMARKVDDSGDGSCYLIYGGRWGLRLKSPACQDPWSLADAHQWGEPFLLLPVDGADVRFAS